MKDAQTFLKIAVTCVGFAAYFAYDYWWTKRKLAEATKARLILEGTPERARLLQEEGVTNA